MLRFQLLQKIIVHDGFIDEFLNATGKEAKRVWRMQNPNTLLKHAVCLSIYLYAVYATEFNLKNSFYKTHFN